ncbi:endonuclease Q family protein [Metabacillus fastidiosus]|uniref:endonuclease Q family protein n=1 Tax=Metabacillus fastidiosus TaxID=1458 RepID=UPI002E2122D5|nr:endonuclease Q family protein [Metabacillus fastidiosus]
MNDYFADLHIHIGRTKSGKSVKITASKTLTLENILIEASEHKGIDIVGVIDCHVPEVLQDLRERIESGECKELGEGGIQFKETVLMLGTELEIYDEFCKGPIHVLAFMPTIEKMIQFSNWLGKRVTNITLSSQRIYENGRVLQEKVKELDGLFIPAHIFTPHKSLYGSGVDFSLKEVFDPSLIDAVELGLSSDTSMADEIAELHEYTYITNSDAHSLPKIGREYQKICLEAPTFAELKLALREEKGRKIVANYGLNPFLGKYYITTCEKCGEQKKAGEPVCEKCGSRRFTKGVSNRLKELASESNDDRERPPYIHQVPLQFIPGLGPKTLLKLKAVFQTEMNIIHEAAENELAEIIPEKLVSYIIAAREGKLQVKAGGGGIYGKVTGV